MAISGKEIIIVGAENQANDGSDTIYTAFNKTANNFTKLFSCASPYTNFVGGNGISTTVTASNGTVKIDSTGVQSVQAGTGVTVLEQDGVVTISASGNGQAGVTNVGISSSTLTVVNSPIISAGVMTVELPALAIDPGIYVAPTVSVDQYGRITEIANSTSIGTVTSVAVTTDGPGLAITGSPVIGDGTITIVNTGVTRVNAGTGIALSGSNGNVTISSTVQAQGTVTRVEVSSNTLTVLNSPITRSGTIAVEIPDNITLAGNLISNTVTSNTLTINTTATVTGTATVGNLTTAGNISGAKLTVTGNANIGNIGTAGILTATGNITGGNISTAGLLTVTGNITGGNLTTAGRLAVTGNANITGNATVNGNLNVNGTIIGSVLGGNVIALQNMGASGNLSITGESNLTSVNITYLFRLTPQATPPATPLEGTVYYDSVTHTLQCYNGTAWKTITMA